MSHNSEMKFKLKCKTQKPLVTAKRSKICDYMCWQLLGTQFFLNFQNVKTSEKFLENSDTIRDTAKQMKIWDHITNVKTQFNFFGKFWKTVNFSLSQKQVEMVKGKMDEHLKQIQNVCVSCRVFLIITETVRVRSRGRPTNN